MGIRVERNPVRPKLRNLRQGAVKGFWTLVGQAINKINVDRLEPPRPCCFHKVKNLLRGLYAVNRLLYIGVKVLHPKAQTIKAHACQRINTTRIDRPWVHFNRVFAPRSETEVVPKQRHQLV